MNLYIHPEFEIVRDTDRCIVCRVCERQCANEAHAFDAQRGHMIAHDDRCVNCHRCVSLCPTHALKIRKSDHAFRENANWSPAAITDIYRQGNTGGVLLSSMGSPVNHPVYFDRILLNASQVTNPSIDPLREPMETRTFLGKRNVPLRRAEDGRFMDDMPAQIELSTPIMFSAMSYGSISYNAHKALAMAAERDRKSVV